MAVLYVSEQGTSIRKTSRRLIVAKDEAVLQVVRLSDLEQVVIYGNVQLTTQAMTTLLDAGIETVFLSQSGRFRGRLAPAESKNIPLRIAQFQRYQDDAFRLSIARSIVAAKIRNGMAVLKRYGRNHPEVGLDEALEQMETAHEKTEHQTTLSALMGVEGSASAAYFRAYGSMFRRELQFSVRSRRPPRDPVNALLSLGYTLLTSETAGALAGHGLDYHIGLFHEIEYGRPSLALDLVEEFRAPIVDRFTLTLVNRGVIGAKDFEGNSDEGFLMNDAARKRYFNLYERMMTTPFTERYATESVTFRSLLRRQAHCLVKAIGDSSTYEPYAHR
jgi:CRISPR-associated protein Cas1